MTDANEALQRLTRWRDGLESPPDPNGEWGRFYADVITLLSVIEWRPISEARQTPGERILFADAEGRVGICWWEPANEGACKPAGWISDACIDFGGFEAPTRYLPLFAAITEDKPHD